MNDILMNITYLGETVFSFVVLKMLRIEYFRMNVSLPLQTHFTISQHMYFSCLNTKQEMTYNILKTLNKYTLKCIRFLFIKNIYYFLRNQSYIYIYIILKGLSIFHSNFSNSFEI